MEQTTTKKLKVFTAFSGYDSQCLALNRLKERFPGFDYELVGWSEIDKNAIKAHNILFPEYADRNFGDISKIDWNTVDDFELFTYSSPCFPPETLVMTVSGRKRISDIRIGEFVLTHNDRFRQVTDVQESEFTGRLMRITIQDSESSGRYIRLTENHPLWVYRRGEQPQWIAALEVKPGDSLCDIDYMENVTPTSHYSVWRNITEVEYEPFDYEGFVYNLEVDEDHSYTAGGFAVSNCTDLSLAGALKGLDEGSGTRSSLLWECRRCIATKRPKFLLLENVTNLVSKRFYDLFIKWVDTVNSYGYESFWTTLNAKHFEIPQNRERVFLVSIRKDSADEKINFAFPEGNKKNLPHIKDFLEKDVPEKYSIDQKKVVAWVKENQKRIIEYISERNHIDISSVKVVGENYNIVEKNMARKKKPETPENPEITDEQLADENISKMEAKDFDDSFAPTKIDKSKPRKEIREYITDEERALRGKDTLKMIIPTPTCTGNVAPTLMASGYENADYKNFYSVGHFPKLGILEIWHHEPTEEELKEAKKINTLI